MKNYRKTSAWVIAVAVVAGLLAPQAAEAAPTCFGHKATIVSNKARVEGTDAPDVIVGGDANQRIDGQGGNDRICAGGGDDVVRGRGGSDRIDGGFSDIDGDRLYGGKGGDLIGAMAPVSDPGYSVQSLLLGGRGPDRLYGSRVSDRLDGGPGPDRIDGFGGS
ncbi:MAG: hypothetical protein QOH90_203, partial [Actinomycetota bacterium]|nr:hypothetical protein [Actinomycetota bacterium]